MKIIGLILLVLLACTGCETLTEAEIAEQQEYNERTGNPSTVPIYVKRF